MESTDASKKLQREVIEESARDIAKKFPGTTAVRGDDGKYTVTCRGKVWSGPQGHTQTFLTGIIVGANLNGLGEKIDGIYFKGKLSPTAGATVGLKAPGRETNYLSWDTDAQMKAFTSGYSLGKDGAL